jgi:hypothetical protein
MNIMLHPVPVPIAKAAEGDATDIDAAVAVARRPSKVVHGRACRL